MPKKSQTSENPSPPTKKQKKAENAEQAPPPKKKKESTALVEYDAWKTVWIYTILDPTIGKYIYAGQTDDMHARGKAHTKKDSKCRRLRAYANLKDLDLNDLMRPYEKLPDGVPHHRANEFEGTLIYKLGTNCTDLTPWGCNQNGGTNLADYEPRIPEIWEEIQAGYKWERPTAAPSPPPEVMAARRKEAMLTTLDAMIGDLRPDISTALTIATEERLKLERSQLGVTELCEAFAADYEALPRDAVVPRSGAIIGMNLVKEKLEAEAERDEQMLALVRAKHLFLKETDSRTWKMTAHVAVHTFLELAGVLESREIERMEKTTTVKKMLKVREWSYAHGQTMPKQQGKDKAERSLGNFLDSLKGGYDACYQGSDAECAFLMRNLPAYATYLAYNLAKKSADIETSLKQLLAEGYGLPNEPAFEGKKQLQISVHRAEYLKLKNLTHGQFDETTTDRILAGLPPSRIAFYKGDYATKRAEYLKKKAESTAKRKAKFHANGVKPNKRSRVEAEEEAETEEPKEEDNAEEEESDEDEDEDKGSDEDEESEE
jgi:hypothetical protein